MLFVTPTLGLTIVMISDSEPWLAIDGHLAALHRLMDEQLIPAAVRGA